jgi:hypothetical protein
MNKYQNNKFSMYNATAVVGGEHADVLESKPPVKAAYDRFVAGTARIVECDRIFIVKTAGITVARNSAFNALVNSTLLVGNALHAMAASQGDDQLKVESHVTSSKLRGMRRNNLQQRAGTILTLAEENAEAMKEFGFESKLVEDLRKAFEEYVTVTGEQSQRRAEVQAASGALDEAIKEVDGILKDELDPLMLLLKDENPDLYGQYKAARVIRDIGGRRGSRQETAVVAEAPQVVEAAKAA